MIWQRYFLKELFKIFFLFLVCFYGLYIIIDYASHTSNLASHNFQIHWIDLGLYYSHIFVSQAEILIPIALLIAVIKTLCTLNVRNELVALMASGIKLKVLLRPFLMVGLFFTLLMFLNEEFILPAALTKLQRIEDGTRNAKSLKRQIASVQSVMLEDGSVVLYQSYDSVHEQFFDAYWIRSLDDIYRIKYLSPYSDVPKGRYVDHLTRQVSGQLARSETFENKDFSEMRFNQDLLHETLTNPELLSLKKLWHQLPADSDAYSEKESQTLAAFYWKLGVPWLCLLAVIAPAPFCIRFSRQLPVFAIYVCGIFGLIAFYLLMDASLIVAKRQVLEPAVALFPPFAIVMGIFLYRYIKV